MSCVLLIQYGDWVVSHARSQRGSDDQYPTTRFCWQLCTPTLTAFLSPTSLEWTLQHLTISNNVSLVGDDLINPLTWQHSPETNNVSLVRRTIHLHPLDTTAPLNLSKKWPFVRLITLSLHWSATEYQTWRYRYDWPCFCSSTLHVNTTTGRGQNRK